MTEEMPLTNITLGEAKQYMTEHFVKHTMKKVSELYFGLDVWDVKALENVSDIDSLRKRNFRLYTQGIEDVALAWWEATQGPMSLPTPESTFITRLEVYLKTKTEDNTIQFGFIVQASELAKKAICNAIMPDLTDKALLVSESAEGIFSFKILL